MQGNLARSLLLLTLCSAMAAAQDDSPGEGPDQRAAEVDALEPGVSSAALLAGDEVETDAEPGDGVASESAAVVAQDVRRRENAGGVMDEIDLERTEITGNQELPKVLYIVPWQKSEPGELTGKPVNSLLDEVLAPIDRSEFIRQVDYYDDLNSEEDE